MKNAKIILRTNQELDNNTIKRSGSSLQNKNKSSTIVWRQKSPSSM